MNLQDTIQENKIQIGAVIVVGLLVVSVIVFLPDTETTTETTVVLPEDSSNLFENGELQRIPTDNNGEPLQGFENAEIGDSVDEFELSTADASNVEDMSHIFSLAEEFNQDISNWDTSNVETMEGMFASAEEFNQDISSWDTSNVEDMGVMFYNAESYNNDGELLNSWDTSNVEDMGAMFSRAENFNQDISSWDTSNVENMGAMFSYTEEFNQDISEWNVRNVENINSMFLQAESFEQDLSSWCGASFPESYIETTDDGDKFIDNIFRGSPLENQHQLHPQVDDC